VRWVALLLALAVASAGDRAGVIGVVLDTTGGSLIDAGVTLMDQDTGIRRSVRTDVRGAYSIATVPPGLYRVTVRQPGFQTIIRWNVQVGPDQDTRLDFTMRLGSMQDVVTVQGGPPSMNTSDAAVGTLDGVKPNGALQQRGVLGLVELSPGVVATPASGGEAGQFSANGLRANTNYFTVDGVSANTTITGAGLPGQFPGTALPAMTAYGSTENLASNDALDEVQILTSTFAPLYGRLPGAQVSLTTRSGSDQFHGSASYSFRNDALDANDSFAQANGLKNVPLRLSQWTATAGGPVRPNRTYFFASYEGLRFRQPYTIAITTPSTAARAQARPDLRRILDAFPSPSITLTPDSLVAERIAQFAHPSRLNSASLRVDHALTAHVTLFGRYQWSPSSTQSGFTAIEGFALRTSSLTLGLTATPAPAVINELRTNIWRTSAESAWTFNPGSSGTPFDLKTVLPLPLGPGPAFYGLVIGGVGALYSGAGGSSRQTQWNFVDTLSVTRGAHTLMFGGDYQRLTPARDNAAASVTGLWPSMAAFEIGFPALSTSTVADRASALIETLSLFAQDAWSITPRLSLTYGLRWEITPPPAMRDPGSLASAGASSGVAAAAPANPALPVADATQPYWRTSYKQMAPRFGAAWRLDGRSVIRAGWGVFYDAAFSAALDPVNGFPFNRWQFGGAGGVTAPVSASYGAHTAPDLVLPYVLEWNVSFERMFGLHDVASISYVGSDGRRLLRREGLLEPTTQLAQTTAATNHGSSKYQALELHYRRRLGRRIQGSAAYTWSHAIDNGSFDSGLYLAASETPPSADRGSASFDVRHNLTVGFTYNPAREWSFFAMLRARTGFPVDLLTTQNFLGLGFDDITRPDLVSGVPLWIPAPTLGGRRLNPAAFRAPATVQGTLGRNAISGFGMSQLDLAAERVFTIREGAQITFRVEAYNSLNHSNPADPFRFLNSPLFGTPVSMLNLMLGSGAARSGLAPIFQTGGPRSLQLNIRLQL